MYFGPVARFPITDILNLLSIDVGAKAPRSNMVM
jgi:hypothetical protein